MDHGAGHGDADATRCSGGLLWQRRKLSSANTWSCNPRNQYLGHRANSRGAFAAPRGLLNTHINLARVLGRDTRNSKVMMLRKVCAQLDPTGMQDMSPSGHDAGSRVTCRK